MEQNENAQELVQVELAVSNARARDKLYLEKGIEQGDIDQAIHRLNLEEDKEFRYLMQEHAKVVKELQW